MKSADEIIRDVCAAHDIDPKCLRREMPHARRYARQRGEVARRLKDELSWSDSKIGKYLGGFHPSTILSNRRTQYVKNPMGPKPATRDQVQRQVWDLRRRIEWLEQRAGFPPVVLGRKAEGRTGTNSPPPYHHASQ